MQSRKYWKTFHVKATLKDKIAMSVLRFIIKSAKSLPIISDA